MDILIIINDPPFGTERSYNSLSMAKSLIRNDPSIELTVFLMANAVACVRHGQKTPSGFYNIEVMLKSVLRHQGVLVCGTCIDAR